MKKERKQISSLYFFAILAYIPNVQLCNGRQKRKTFRLGSLVPSITSSYNFEPVSTKEGILMTWHSMVKWSTESKRWVLQKLCSRPLEWTSLEIHCNRSQSSDWNSSPLGVFQHSVPAVPLNSAAWVHLQSQPNPKEYFIVKNVTLSPTDCLPQ